MLPYDSAIEKAMTAAQVRRDSGAAARYRPSQRDTVAGNAWLVADTGGKCLGIFTSESTWTRASVRVKR